MENDNHAMSWWIYLLRILGGYLNVITLFLFNEMTAGHTGRLSHAMMKLIEGDYYQMIILLIITSCYFVGTMLSGFVSPTNHNSTHFNYGHYFILIGMIMLIFSLTSYQTIWFLLFITFILGFQNGMFVPHKGAIIRTIIITSTLTDIGTEIGRQLRGEPAKSEQLYFNLKNICFYLLGVLIATFVILYTSLDLVMIIGIYLLSLGGYFYYFKGCLLTSVTV